MTFIYYNKEEGSTMSEERMEELYDDMLDECGYDPKVWRFSKLLQDSDPIAYNCGFSDYVDSLGYEEADSEEIEEDSDEV